jgi:hypothetical protein
VLKPTAEVQLIWQDETGSTGMTSVHAPVGLTVDEIDAGATALASILASLTGAVLVKQHIKYRSVTVPKPEPVNSTPIVRSGIFFFLPEAPAPYGIVNVPAIKESVINDAEPLAGLAIDRDNSDIIAFVAAILSLGATNPFGDVFVALDVAYRQSRV